MNLRFQGALKNESFLKREIIFSAWGPCKDGDVQSL